MFLTWLEIFLEIFSPIGRVGGVQQGRELDDQFLVGIIYRAPPCNYINFIIIWQSNRFRQHPKLLFYQILNIFIYI